MSDTDTAKPDALKQSETASRPLAPENPALKQSETASRPLAPENPALRQGETASRPIAPETPTPPARKKFAVVTLEEPLVRGEQSISQVRLRKPVAGDYRGTTMSAAYQMDPVALAKVISRVSDPMISEQEFLAMDADDAAELGGEIVDFLLTTRKKEAAGLNG